LCSVCYYEVFLYRGIRKGTKEPLRGCIWVVRGRLSSVPWKEKSSSIFSRKNWKESLLLGQLLNEKGKRSESGYYEKATPYIFPLKGKGNMYCQQSGVQKRGGKRYACSLKGKRVPRPPARQTCEKGREGGNIVTRSLPGLTKIDSLFPLPRRTLP